MKTSTGQCLEGLASNCLQFARVNDSLAELTKLQQNLCSQEMICQAKLRRCQHIRNESSGRLIGQVASHVDGADRAKLCQYYTAVRRCIDVNVDESCWRHPDVARVLDVIRQAEQDNCSTTTEKPTHEHEGIFLRCPQLAECLQANDTQCSGLGDTLDCLQKTEYDCGVGQNQRTLELLREETLAACRAHRTCLQNLILWNASVSNEPSGTTMSDRDHYMIPCANVWTAL
ncbi:uncharacterized protein LOC112560475 isoform X2 [Pomacea canaliculata]|uniref:uncharacterized protein LOC112560475 isoform X2 n=1 Tax=Pomacea canaliculata TaxID=400727 RepID=UPI000D734DC0|nr:uncharacterized protein LOC112560475 isoform X2 [Pomacea canaliculata]